MSTPRQGFVGSLAALDPISKGIAARFGLRLSCFVALAVVPIVSRTGSFAGVAALLAVTFSFGAFFSGTVALLRRQPLGHGCLNDWDEAVAFIAMSQLAHLAARI